MLMNEHVSSPSTVSLMLQMVDMDMDGAISRQDFIRYSNDATIDMAGKVARGKTMQVHSDSCEVFTARCEAWVLTHKTKRGPRSPNDDRTVKLCRPSPPPPARPWCGGDPERQHLDRVVKGSGERLLYRGWVNDGKLPGGGKGEILPL